MISNERINKVTELLDALLHNGIAYVATPEEVVEGYHILTFDKEERPLASVILHKFSYGNEQNLFETAIIDENGNRQEPIGWQTVQEVLDTLLSAM